MPITMVDAWSADSHSSTTLTQEFVTVSGITINSANQRTGVNCFAIGASGVLRKNLTATMQDLVMGLAFKPTFIGAASVPRMFVFLDNGSDQIYVGFLADGSVRASLGDGTVLGTSGPGVVPNNVYSYIETSVHIAAAGGTVVVRVNEVQVLSFTGNTRRTVNSYATQVELNLSSGATTSYADDVFLYTATGGSTFAGDTKIIEPTLSAGTYGDFTATGAASRLAAIQESAPDGATSYNASNVAGAHDTFTMGALGVSGTVYGVGVYINASTDTGTRSIQALLKKAAQPDALSAAMSVNVGFATRNPGIFSTQPDGTALTDASINGMEIGYQIP